MSKIKSDGKPFASEFIYMYIYGHLKYVRWTKLQAPVVVLGFIKFRAKSFVITTYAPKILFYLFINCLFFLFVFFISLKMNIFNFPEHKCLHIIQKLIE